MLEKKEKALYEDVDCVSCDKLMDKKKKPLYENLNY